MKHKLVKSTLYTAMLLIALGVFIFLYWLYSPPKEVLSVSPNPIPILTKKIQGGMPNSFVVLKVTRCKNITATGRLVITLVGQNVQLTLPVTSETSERKCDTDISVPIALPPQALPGTYHYHFRVTYTVNPITTVTQDFDTENFEVVQ